MGHAGLNGFLQPKIGIPQFQVLAEVIHEGEQCFLHQRIKAELGELNILFHRGTSLPPLPLKDFDHG
jgi:hypothetical protein